MPWVKFSDDWYDDGKLAGADPAVLAMWAVGISWSARNLTDGEIPMGEHRRLVNLYGTFDSEGQCVHPDHVADELVRRGAWLRDASSFTIVNYHRYQPTKEKVLAEREAAKERAAKSRGGARELRANFDRSAAPPVPVPDIPSSSSENVNPPGLPEGLWMRVAEKQMAASSVPIGSPAAWKRKAAANAKAEYAERAAWLWATYEISEPQLVDVLCAGGSSPLLNSLRKREAA